jgi:hypothetical protein
MTAINFLKKATGWTPVFLCILLSGSASVSLGSQPAGTIPRKGVEIIALETRGFSGGPRIGPSATRSEKVESLPCEGFPPRTSKPKQESDRQLVWTETSQQADGKRAKVQHVQKHPGPQKITLRDQSPSCQH